MATHLWRDRFHKLNPSELKSRSPLEKIRIQLCHNILSKTCNFQEQNIETFKEIGKCECYSGGKNHSNVGISKDVKQPLLIYPKN